MESKILCARPKEKPNWLKDRNDCTVRALATAMNLEYMEAWTVLKCCAGRKKNEGIVFQNWLSTQEKFITLEFCGQKPLVEIINQFARGRYIVIVRGHTFALIDGTVYDYQASATERVFSVWKIKEKLDY